MKFILNIEHGYSNCYPKEQNDLNCFKLKFDTIEKVSEYVNDLYEKTKEHCNGPPCLELDGNILGFVMHTYDFIPEDKRATREDIIGLLRDEKDYENIPSRDIEMYSITIWLKVLK